MIREKFKLSSGFFVLLVQGSPGLPGVPGEKVSQSDHRAVLFVPIIL